MLDGFFRFCSILNESELFEGFRLNSRMEMNDFVSNSKCGRNIVCIREKCMRMYRVNAS